MSAAASCVLRRHAAAAAVPRRLVSTNTYLVMQDWRVAPSVMSLSSRSLSTSVKEEKLAAKERRTELWQNAQKRVERLKTRRDGKPKNEKQTAFREWFDKRRIYQEIMDRKARQAKLDWTIQAAAILERLPVITRDRPEWELEYFKLKSYLGQFGKEYPKELNGFGRTIENPAMTEEELLGTWS